MIMTQLEQVLGKNPWLNNKENIGKWVQVSHEYGKPKNGFVKYAEAASIPFKVVDVTGQWYYGFTTNGQPHIVNCCVYVLEYIKKIPCDRCDVAYLPWKLKHEQSGHSYCGSCLDIIQDDRLNTQYPNDMERE